MQNPVSGWHSYETKTTDQLSKNSWAQGYFHSSQENWDGKTWIRNFHELRCRDLALFAVGDIKNKKVLDIGCGSGEYLVTMAKMGAIISGQDIDPDIIRSAQDRLKNENFSGDLKVGDATRLQFPANYFDCVFSADFFEHISRDQKEMAIKEIFRVLKPGGTLTVKTPNLSYLRLAINLKRIKALLTFRSPFIYVAHTRNNPNNEHHGLTTYFELEEILEDHFFHIPRIVYTPLVRKGLPKVITRLLFGKKLFSEHIIITTRKALFYSLYE